MALLAAMALTTFSTSFATDITRKAGGTSVVKCAVFQAGFSAPYYAFAQSSVDVTRTTPLTAPTIVYFADEASDRFNGLLGTNLVDISTDPAAPNVFSKVVNTPTPHIVQVSAWRVGYNIFFSVVN